MSLRRVPLSKSSSATTPGSASTPAHDRYWSFQLRLAGLSSGETVSSTTSPSALFAMLIVVASFPVFKQVCWNLGIPTCGKDGSDGTAARFLRAIGSVKIENAQEKLDWIAGEE